MNKRSLNTFLIILIVGFAALFAYIELMPMQDYQKLKGGSGVEAAPKGRPSPKATPRRLTPEEQREAMANPKRER